MSDIKLIISDFDGTLVDTFEANYLAYNAAFTKLGLLLSKQQYQESFGLRFDKFMERVGVDDQNLREKIKELKQGLYPLYFENINLNKSLLDFLICFKKNGGLLAIGSTANRINLNNVLNYFKLFDLFDSVLSGEDVINGKPDPEIYNTIINNFSLYPENTIIFEDSLIGLEAAKACGARVIKINKF